MSHDHDHDAVSPVAADNAAAAVQYYRSLEHFEGTPAYRDHAEREFPEGASEWPADSGDAPSRRRFLGLVAASVALAGLQGCRKPYRKIFPMAAQPEGVTPGVPMHYASAFVAGGYGYGTIVRSNDGRPTKVEGNPKHPASLGGCSQYMQAEILSLYDPARSTQPHARHGQDHGAAAAGAHAPAHGAAPAGESGGGHEESHLDRGAQVRASAAAAWSQFEAWFGPFCKTLRDRGGEGVRFLLEASTSPTLRGLIEKTAKQKLPKAGFHFFAPLNRDQELAGARLAFGKPLDTQWMLDAAECVVAFEADFLGLDGDTLANSRRWAKRRKITEPGQTISRLYVAESTYTVTGASADHRFRLSSHEVADAALALAAELFLVRGLAADGMTDELKNALGAWREHGFKSKGGKNWIAVIAQDLLANRGKSCVMAGSRQPAVVHAVLHAVNKALGNQGKTVVYTQTDPAVAVDQAKSIRDLAADLDKGTVDTLFCLGTNPVYHAPAELDFAAKLAKAKHKVHLGLHRDETAKLCDWHVNQAHDLEAWGDIRAYDGTLSVVQPLIAPLYEGWSVLELLAHVLDAGKPAATAPDGHAATQPKAAAAVSLGYDLVRAEWREAAKQGAFEATWSETLRSGVLAGSQFPRNDNVAVSSAEIAKAVAAQKKSAAPTREAVEVTFWQDAKLYDGRYANNGWLMEMPDPLSKLTWGNAALMSRATAIALGVKDEDVVKVTLDGKSIELPALVLPGQADWSLALMLGYGRRFDDDTHGEDVDPRCFHLIAQDEHGAPHGCNVYPLRTSAAMHMAKGASVTKTGATHQLAITQDHGAMEERPIVREGTLAQFQAEPEFAYLMSPAAQQARVKTFVAKKHEAHAAHGSGEHGHGHEPAPEVTEDDINTSLWTRRELEKESPDYQWAMVIDLSSCTGCNACVVACQAENNVPTAGKAQVRMNREMHWLRIDRYFGGIKGKAELSGPNVDRHFADDPSAVHMPVPCMQCENAPCESVCPVMATTHTPDGLNDMTYNRCVGTRYCSNNCPYKVRRFNFFGYTNRFTDTQQMAFNPDVTVRSRGVMEKCTYCTQRITAAKLHAKKESRLVKDGEIKPACVQTCPTEAITFGNLMEPTSRVNALRKSKLNYEMLGDLNTRPRTTYLAKIRNKNPELAES